MGISLYYQAKRSRPLTPEERSTIDGFVKTYSANQNEHWEGFYVYPADDPSEANVVFEGATGMPDDSPEDMWEALQHWTALLTEIRRAVPDASWSVHMDDHDISWDEATQEYDPSQ